MNIVEINLSEEAYKRLEFVSEKLDKDFAFILETGLWIYLKRFENEYKMYLKDSQNINNT